MNGKIVNRRDLEFVLFELLEADKLTERPHHGEHSVETFRSALDTAQRIATDHFASHNRKADENEPQLTDGRVKTVPEIKAALAAFAQAGFVAATHDFDKGGMQLPVVIAQACFAYFHGANVSTAAYPFLSIANANLLRAFASDAQRRRYLPHLLSGRFFGTMALTEPQAGSSLADITTAARYRSDGTYAITGRKIFISGGDHELSENIIHLVLARIPGGPPGVKGISLFLVPKYRVLDDEGTLGARNDIALAGLIHKMGFRGTTSTMLNFGEQGECVGELIGEPHQGLSYMFHMMNEARIGVGLGATMLGYTGYLHALDYARSRPQGRAQGARDLAAAPVPIIEHTDVRRMLLAQKAYAEGGLALCLFASRLLDDSRGAASEYERTSAAMLLDLLTPAVKSWPSQFCLEANSLAIQVHGGYGYTREYPVEQFYRDNRLNAIHEGTHGIQALDLLGRKVLRDAGTSMAPLLAAVNATVEDAAVVDDLELNRYSQALDANWIDIVATTRILSEVARNDMDLALANASLYLEMLGHSVVAWLWLRAALVAQRALTTAATGADADADFYHGKRAACRYFFQWELPKTEAQRALLKSLDRSCHDMRDPWF